MDINDLNWVVAICPDCGKECYGWNEESAKKNYYKNHKCMATKTDKQIQEILDRAREVIDETPNSKTTR